MSNNLRKCLKKLELYCDTDCKKLKMSLLKEISKNDCYYKALHEIIHNICRKKLPIKSDNKKGFKKYIGLMNNVLSKPKSKRTRIKLIKQSGGFWPLIIPIVTSVLTEVIENAIRKKSNVNSS